MKTNRIRFLIALVVISFISTALVSAEQEELKPVAESIKVGYESITGADAINYITFLSADELEGRDTASNGLRIARNYVASLYKIWGIVPAGDVINGQKSYSQAIQFVITQPGPGSWIEVQSGASTRRFLSNVDLFIGGRTVSPGLIEAPVVFAGYGISAEDLGYDDLQGVDLKGKIALVVSGTPGGDREDSPFNDPKNRNRFSWRARFRVMSETLKQAGAVAVVQVRTESGSPMAGMFERQAGPYKQGNRIPQPDRDMAIPALISKSGSIPMFNISEQVADFVLSSAGRTFAEAKEAIDSSLKPNSMALSDTVVRINVDAYQRSDTSGNVIGIIEGSDPELKNEYVLIGAHLDHVGMTEDGYVFNGADDNASGSAGVLELAQAFMLNPVKPKRSIIFAHWTGEEKGLLGSKYYAEFPTVPRDKIVVCLNMDMISRDWTMDVLERMARRMPGVAGSLKPTPEIAKKLLTVSLSAQSPDLNTAILKMNTDHIGLFCFTRPGREQMGGSDHVPFHQKNIPAAFFFSASHDDYHQPSDTVEKLNADKMEKIIRLIYLVAFEIANNPERLAWNE